MKLEHAILSVAACLLFQTGYIAVHHHLAEKKAQHDKDEAAATAARELRKAKAKAAWIRAASDLVDDLDTYLFVENGNRLSGIRSVAINTYEIADITWKGEKEVIVTGIAIPNAELHKSPYYAWRRTLTWLDDDDWGAGRLTFSPTILSDKQKESMFTITKKP